MNTQPLIQDWEKRIANHQKKLQIFQQTKQETDSFIKNLPQESNLLPLDTTKVPDFWETLSIVKAAKKAGLSMVETTIPGEHEPVAHLFDLGKKNLFSNDEQVAGYVETMNQELVKVNDYLKAIAVNVCAELVGAHFYLSINSC